MVRGCPVEIRTAQFVPLNFVLVKAYTHRERREKGKIAFGRRLRILLDARDAAAPRLP
jgi:hypothetical protein